MAWVSQALNSSIGKKLFMSLTGLFLITFLCIHLFGNMFLYVGQDAFNLYVHTLETGVVHATSRRIASFANFVYAIDFFRQ